MIYIIPYGTDHTVTATGAGAKLVRCEQCDGEYVYTMQMTGQGASTSFFHINEAGAEARARAEAAASLAASLDQGCAIVPCPACGHIQQHMVAAARRDRHYWMKRTALPAFLIAIPLSILALATTDFQRPGGPGAKTPIAWVFRFGLAAAVLAPVALPLVRRVLAARYDPNTEPQEERMRRGREFAVPKDVYFAGREPAAG